MGLSSVLLSSLGGREHSLRIYLRFFGFVRRVVDLGCNGDVELTEPVSDGSGSQMRLASFLTSGGRLFRVRYYRSGVSLGPVSEVPLSHRVGHSLFLRPAVLRLPIDTDLLSRTPETGRPPARGSDSKRGGLPGGVARSCFFLPKFISLDC